jgi:hypothetical protein
MWTWSENDIDFVVKIINDCQSTYVFDQNDGLT